MVSPVLGASLCAFDHWVGCTKKIKQTIMDQRSTGPPVSLVRSPAGSMSRLSEAQRGTENAQNLRCRVNPDIAGPTKRSKHIAMSIRGRSQGCVRPIKATIRGRSQGQFGRENTQTPRFRTNFSMKRKHKINDSLPILFFC